MITYKKFNELIDRGECQTVDFKIECNAFGKGNEKFSAELIKDIIALSNNGNVASYLIIGVSDDRNGFKSVENTKLTDDNLQNLCKDYIHPVPKVKLYRCSWDKVNDKRHEGKTFVIIQIGPQARQCFRFNRDLIDYKDAYCFRKNEVWIRREATSDLATPEEIKRLVDGKPPSDVPAVESCVVYNRLPEENKMEAIWSDIEQLVKNSKGKIDVVGGHQRFLGNSSDDQSWAVISLPVDGMKLKLVLLYMDKCNEKGIVYRRCHSIPVFHHGILLISHGNVTPLSTEGCSLNFKEEWGWFCTNRDTRLGYLIDNIPIDKQELKWADNETFCLCIGNVKSTQDLQRYWVNMVDDLKEKSDINDYVREMHEYINNTLVSWRKTECLYDTGNVYYDDSAKPKRGTYTGKRVKCIKENEVYDIEKYGIKVMAKSQKACKIIDSFLSE